MDELIEYFMNYDKNKQLFTELNISDKTSMSLAILSVFVGTLSICLLSKNK